MSSHAAPTVATSSQAPGATNVTLDSVNAAVQKATDHILELMGGGLVDAAHEAGMVRRVVSQLQCASLLFILIVLGTDIA